MKKKLVVLSAVYTIFLGSEQLNIHSAQATTNAHSIDDKYTTQSHPPTTENNNQDLKLVFDRLYNEGFTLGQKDGYEEKLYESFNEGILIDKSSEEFRWFEMGYTVGYQKGKRQKEVELQAKQEAERKLGEELGFDQGVKDYKNATIASNPQNYPNQSKDWNKGFVLGYKKSIELMDISIKAKKEGFEQGKTTESINIPYIYANEDITKKAFEEGFESGRKEQTKQLNERYIKQGYEQGYELKTLVIPEDVPEQFKPAFEKGYNKGVNSKKKDVIALGFNDAFIHVGYQTPQEYITSNNTTLKEWHKKGFKSNKDADHLRKQAYQQGWKIGEKISIPTKYEQNKAAVSMYKHYYQLGKAKREETSAKIFIGFGLLLSIGSLVGYMTLRRKKIKDLKSIEANYENKAS